MYAQLERSQFVLRSLDKIIKKEPNVDLEALEQMENVTTLKTNLGDTISEGKGSQHHLFKCLEFTI